ncbi:MAG: serpin family protein [Candidatus Brockarchaeota archaeon]|nr:serpin family protein [Candidatus Brockarchaeota archaeon]
MVKKRLWMVGVALLMITLVPAVAAFLLFPYSPTKPPKANDAGSTPQGVQEVVRANNQFAFKLYSELVKTETGNVFYSPYSIFSALAMTYEGARGETAEEMKNVFGFPESDILKPNFAAIYNCINEASKDYELRTGNALWVQKDYPFLEDYLKTVEEYYGGKAAVLDFINEAEKSRETINTFIGEQTNHKIKDLIPPGALDEFTRLVLTNAIYFKGDWKIAFNQSLTMEEDFWVEPNRAVKVQMMHMRPNETIRFNYADTGDAQIIELPYRGEKISMIIVLPKDFEAFESSLTLEKLDGYRAQMKEEKLDEICLPKFELETKYFMRDALSNLGMPTAFSGVADFSGMTGRRDLFISEVIHQAYVKVDEKGTEAAAATAVIMRLTAVPETKVFKADHPFFFMIQERETGSILFMGRIINPTG